MTAGQDGGNDLLRRQQAYHAGHAKQAIEVLRQLAAGGKKVRPSDARSCKDYATEVFGHPQYAAWLLVYTAVSGAFKEGWIPDNFYGAKVVPAIQGRHGRVSFLKSLSGALFGSPAFPDVGSRINGALFDTAYRPLSFDEARDRFFDSADRLVFKFDNSGRGRDIRFFDKGSFDQATIEALGNGVFQRHISQHPKFDLFTSTAVAAIRITTAVEGSGAISPRAAYLCLGMGSDTHVHAQSRMRVALDVATGALREWGLLANWQECRDHPTSGEPFAGKVIPDFAQCLSTVVALHQRVPFIGAVGWDVTVDRDGEVRVLEWNAYHNGIGFSEATAGPCFKGLGWERFA